MPTLKDFVTDQNPIPLHLAAAAEMEPDYVKTASMLTPDDLAGVHHTMFADPVLRLLPVFTKEATWMSAAYFHGSREWQDMPDVVKDTVSACITKAASVHGIDRDVADVAKFMRQILEAEAADDMEKAASADTINDYALLVDFGGSTKAYYPIFDDVSIVKSARAVVEDFHAGKIPVDWYVQTCREVVKAAETHKVDARELPERVLAAGEERLPDFDVAREVAELRKRAGASDEIVAVYKDIVDQAESAYHEGDHSMDKWASLWLELDTMNKVAYDRFTPDPYQAFYSGDRVSDLEKAASEMVLVGEALVPRQVIAAIDDRMLSAMFRKDAAEIIKEAREAAAAGPGPDASQIMAGLSNEDVTVLLRGLVAKHQPR